MFTSEEGNLLTTVIELVVDMHGLGMSILKLFLDQVLDGALYEWVLHDYLVHATFVDSPLRGLAGIHPTNTLYLDSCRSRCEEWLLLQVLSLIHLCHVRENPRIIHHLLLPALAHQDC